MFVIACIIAIGGTIMVFGAIVGTLRNIRREREIRKHKDFLNRNSGWML